MIGFRHTPTCNCGCQFVVGHGGEVVERLDTAGICIVRFEVPSLTSDRAETHEVAYWESEVSANGAVPLSAEKANNRNSEDPS